ncbi:hypothetical protein PCE1_004998 [Barthelona sp. PCE]
MTELVYSDLEVPATVFSMAFHPTEQILAVGCIDGSCSLFRVKALPESSELIFTFKCHNRAVRCLSFTANGDYLLTAGSSQSLKLHSVEHLLAGEDNVTWKKVKAHAAPISAMLYLGGYLVITGDDEGTIKMWNLETQMCTMSVKETNEGITSLAYEPEQAVLCAGGADGYLYVFDLASKELLMISENLDDEQQSMLFISRKDPYLVTGTLEGKINFWKMDQWDLPCNAFHVHPDSVSAIIAVTDELYLTGSSDGLIRVLSFMPNEPLGMIGDHDFPIENLTLNCSKSIVASSSHGDCVKLWDTSFLVEEEEEVEETQPEQLKIVPKKKKRRNNRKKKSKPISQNSRFFSGL